MTFKKSIAVILSTWMLLAPSVAQAQGLPPYFFGMLEAGRQLKLQMEEKEKQEAAKKLEQQRQAEQKKQAATKSKEEQKYNVQANPNRFGKGYANPQDEPGYKLRLQQKKAIQEDSVLDIAEPSQRRVASSAVVAVQTQDKQRDSLVVVVVQSQPAAAPLLPSEEKLRATVNELNDVVRRADGLNSELDSVARVARGEISAGTAFAIETANTRIEQEGQATILELRNQLNLSRQAQEKLTQRLEKMDAELKAAREAKEEEANIASGRRDVLAIAGVGALVVTALHCWGGKSFGVFLVKTLTGGLTAAALLGAALSSFKTEAAINLPGLSLDEQVHMLVEKPALFGAGENGINPVMLASIIKHAPWVDGYFENYTSTLRLLNKYPEMSLEKDIKGYLELPEEQQNAPEYFKRMARAAKLYDRRARLSVQKQESEFIKESLKSLAY